MDRVLTRKSIIVELAIVTAGVVIALSFDSVREWRQNQALAVEARENLLSEIRLNKRELDDEITKIEADHDAYKHAFAAIQNALANKPASGDQVNFRTGTSDLVSAAFATAEITGAFRYMNYAETRRFAGIDDAQQKYIAVQDEARRNVALLTSFILLPGSPEAMTRADMEEFKRRLQTGYATLQVQLGLAKNLAGTYADVLNTP